MVKSLNQTETLNSISRIFNIFKKSGGVLRPHFILTGESGSGKSFSIRMLSEMEELNYIEINAAQLTKEGVSGNSLSKSLSALTNYQNKLTICFVDEFDKLFISGNSNSQLAHESTNGVQNEFLKVLESDTAHVYGDYGRYIDIGVNNVLFVFAGAFNGEKDIDLDRLRAFGIKTEFLGRVGLTYSLSPLSIDDLFSILENSHLFNTYCELFSDVDQEMALLKIKSKIQESFDNNTLGARMVNTLIHQYFITGGFPSDSDVKKVTFQEKLTF